MNRKPESPLTKKHLIVQCNNVNRSLVLSKLDQRGYNTVVMVVSNIEIMEAPRNTCV